MVRNADYEEMGQVFQGLLAGIVGLVLACSFTNFGAVLTFSLLEGL